MGGIKTQNLLMTIFSLWSLEKHVEVEIREKLKVRRENKGSGAMEHS